MAFKQVVLRSALGYDTDNVSRETGLAIDPDDSVVQQQFKDECDINVIVKRFGLTGELPNGIDMPVSGDFTGVTDFHTALTLVRQAQESFQELPAEIRERFNNEPAKVIAFLDNAQNRDEAIRLGMIAKPVEKPRDIIAAVDELAAKLVPKA